MRQLERWTDWRPKWEVPRWVIFLIYGMLLIVIAAQLAQAQDPVPLEEPCTESECTLYNQAFVMAQTGDQQTLKWAQDQGNLDTMDLIYRAEGHDFPPKTPSVPFMTGDYPEGTNVHTWTPARAGLFYFRVKACRTDIIQDPNDPAFEADAELRPGTTDEWILCSVWAISYDPTYTDPVKFPRGFTMIVQLAPATGGTIE